MESKVMEEVSLPKIAKPVEPIQEYRMDNFTPTNGSDFPVLDDKLYGMKFYKYMVKYKEFRSNKIVWVQLNTNIYNLCLQHIPPELELVLK